MSKPRMTMADMPNVDNRVYGLASFQLKDWDRWRQIDPELPEDWYTWHRGHHEAFLNQKTLGCQFIAVSMDPDVYLAWASAMGDKASIPLYVDTRMRNRR